MDGLAERSYIYMSTETSRYIISHYRRIFNKAIIGSLYTTICQHIIISTSWYYVEIMICRDICRHYVEIMISLCRQNE